MNKKKIRIIGGAAIVGVLALSAATGVGSASAKSLVSKAGITKPAHEGRGPAKSLTAAAGVLKLTEAELKAQVEAGKSLADVAATQNVSVQSVIDVVVTEMKTHIASEVTSGELTQAQADEKLANVTARATDMVNGVRPAGGHNGRGGHGRSHGPVGDAPAQPGRLRGDPRRRRPTLRRRRARRSHRQWRPQPLPADAALSHGRLGVAAAHPVPLR